MTTTQTNLTLDQVQNVDQLEQLLSEPTDYAIDTLAQLKGDLIILGVGGKMGPTLAMMAKRASDAAGVNRRVIGVSRFSSGDLQARLHQHGIETIKADLLDPEQLKQLPDAPNVLYMAGMKFGSTNQEALTWAMNTYLPGMVCQRYPHSKIVAFSTGNVYGLQPLTLGGSLETDILNPTGDYAMSCMGRERMFEHFSRTHNIPTAIIRLNYAVELRYGVLIDLATKIKNNQPIDLTMGNFNAIWQGDANAMTLGAFAHVDTPPFVLNVAGPELLSVRRVCEQMATAMNTEAQFIGEEAHDGILSNGQAGHHLFGYPRMAMNSLIEKTATWIQTDGALLGKPTHFEARDGKY